MTTPHNPGDSPPPPPDIDEPALGDATSTDPFISVPDGGDREGLTESLGAVGWVLAGIVGIVVGALGTTVHRISHGSFVTGVILALAAVVLGAILSRTIADKLGVLIFAAGTFGTTIVLTYVSRGGDVLLTSEGHSMLWLLGAPLVALVGLVDSTRLYGRGPNSPSQAPKMDESTPYHGPEESSR